MIDLLCDTCEIRDVCVIDNLVVCVCIYYIVGVVVEALQLTACIMQH